ncbi:hypothetical protein BASA61_007297 [Batrachochytrium salamandrivorans]|nr:hypothetical protein BASA61_007297 [Batrachochytrium salamandrivorans]KAH9271065.1 hypothetical protein BASA83_006818 [Batrachochytrium salamandrivorans]
MKNAVVQLTLAASSQCETHLAQVWSVVDSFYNLQDTHIDQSISRLLEIAGKVPLAWSKCHRETAARLAQANMILASIESRLVQAEKDYEAAALQFHAAITKEEVRFSSAQKSIQTSFHKKLHEILETVEKDQLDQSRNEAMLKSLISASHVPLEQ